MSKYVHSPAAAWGRTLPWGPHSARPKSCALEVINMDVAVFTCQDHVLRTVVTRISEEQLRLAQTSLHVRDVRRIITHTGSYLGNPEWYMPLQNGWALQLHKRFMPKSSTSFRA